MTSNPWQLREALDTGECPNVPLETIIKSSDVVKDEEAINVRAYYTPPPRTKARQKAVQIEIVFHELNFTIFGNDTEEILALGKG